MSTFLERILKTKHEEVIQLKDKFQNTARISLDFLPCKGFAQQISQGSKLSIIAEIKKASPSKGLIAEEFRPKIQAKTYEQAGAACISVLTDKMYFQGSIEDLIDVRNTVELPILRKDFIIDESQIIEARLAGADAILLIVAALPDMRLKELSAYAQSLGLDVLIEVHTREEVWTAMKANPSVIGINNRDLHTFQVNLSTTEEVIQEIPATIPVISESGIQTKEDAIRLAAFGVSGLLVGESLMRMTEASAIARTVGAFQVQRAVGLHGSHS